MDAKNAIMNAVLCLENLPSVTGALLAKELRIVAEMPHLDILTKMRAFGWRVAVHNDYMKDGALWTFWLFTHNGAPIYVKGEAKTDEEALYQCAREARRAGRYHTA